MRPTTPLSSPKAVAAVVLLFCFNGLVLGIYAASIPTYVQRFNLQAIHLSWLFIAVGVAAIAAMQITGRIIDRRGARKMSIAIFPLLIVGVLGAGLSTSLPMLIASAMVLGIANGGIDVAMNAIGVQVEQHRPKPIMSFFHGMWSVGNLTGAALIVLLAQLFAQAADPTVYTASILAAIVGVGLWVVAWRIIPETITVEHVTAEGGKAPIPRIAWLLGLMAIAAGFGEGTAMDWSSLHITEAVGVDATTGSLGVTVVAAFMVVIRLSGDFLVTRFGRRTVARFGGVAAALGYLITALGASMPVLLLGWALVGLGIGMVAPQVYAVAGHSAGGRGLAVAVTFGYATMLAGPAIIGPLVQSVGIQHAMLLPAVLLLGLLAIAKVMPRREDDPSLNGNNAR